MLTPAGEPFNTSSEIAPRKDAKPSGNFAFVL
jgi:hypothetical protein